MHERPGAQVSQPAVAPISRPADRRQWQSVRDGLEIRDTAKTGLGCWRRGSDSFCHRRWRDGLVQDVIFKGATVQGIYGRRMYGTWVQMTALLKAGRLSLEPLFGERMALDGFEAAFAKLQSGLAGKILLYPDGIRK